MVHQRTGKHARHAALALLRIDYKVALRDGERGDGIPDPDNLTEQATDSRSDGHGATDLDEIPPRRDREVLLRSLLWSGHVGVAPYANVNTLLMLSGSTGVVKISFASPRVTGNLERKPEFAIDIGKSDQSTIALRTGSVFAPNQESEVSRSLIHEREQDAVCADHRVDSMDKLFAHRATPRGRFGCASDELRRTVSGHGPCSTDLARVHARHRSYPGRHHHRLVPEPARMGIISQHPARPVHSL